MSEIWKEIIGYEDYYQVSNYGNVRSVDRMVWSGRVYYIYKGQSLKANQAKVGYYTVTLSKRCLCKMTYIHRLVATHFVQNIDNKKQVNHIDGNKLNNMYSNLEWVTNKENSIHAHKIGLTNNAGERNGQAKLSGRNVIRIRQLKGKYSQMKMGEMFGVSASVIGLIHNNKLWTK